MHTPTRRPPALARHWSSRPGVLAAPPAAGSAGDETADAPPATGCAVAAAVCAHRDLHQQDIRLPVQVPVGLRGAGPSRTSSRAHAVFSLALLPDRADHGGVRPHGRQPAYGSSSWSAEATPSGRWRWTATPSTQRWSPACRTTSDRSRTSTRPAWSPPTSTASPGHRSAYSVRHSETAATDTWTLTLVEPESDYRLEVQATSPADAADRLEPVWTEVINSFTTL